MKHLIPILKLFNKPRNGKMSHKKYYYRPKVENLVSIMSINLFGNRNKLNLPA